MKNYIVKLVVTNSVNDDKRIEWSFFDTEEEKSIWVNEKKDEQAKWNYKTLGAVSFRYYDFEYFNTNELMNCNMSEFEGMTLSDFLGIVKNCL